jgi:hypothetical protein
VTSSVTVLTAPHHETIVLRTPSAAPNVLEREVGRQYAALDTPRNDDFVVRHPIVDMTRMQPIETRLVEFVVHGSDLAQSVGRRNEIEDEMSSLLWAALALLAELRQRRSDVRDRSRIASRGLSERTPGSSLSA